MTRNDHPSRAVLSRRDAIKLSGLGMGVLGALGLSSCAGNAGGSKPLIWANWTIAIDFDEKTGAFPTIDQFIEETGIDVDYFEEIDDSATFYAKIREQLEQDKFPGYDLFNFADDYTARLIGNGMVQEIDAARIPNLANMSEYLRNPSYDLGRKYSVPWQGGMTGICYNTELFPAGVATVSDFADPRLKGKVGILTEMIDTVGLTMLDQGVDVDSDWGDQEFDAALAEIQDRLRSGQYAQATGNSYTQDLERGDIWAAMCWSGDIEVLNAEAGKEQFKFVIPEPGGMKYVNSILVPNGTDRMKDIEVLIDFFYRPEVQAQIVAYTATMPPIDGVREELAKIDPELAQSKMVFPEPAELERLFDFRQLDSSETKKYVERFSKVLGL